MKRECTRCGRPFTPGDLAREESREMAAKRRAAGLEGVRFLYYSCPRCAGRHGGTTCAPHCVPREHTVKGDPMPRRPSRDYAADDTQARPGLPAGCRPPRAEEVLRDVAFVLSLTRRVRASIDAAARM